MKSILFWLSGFIFLKFTRVITFLLITVPSLLTFGYSTGLAIWLLIIYIILYEYFIEKRIFKGHKKEYASQCWQYLKESISEYKERSK